MWLLWESRLRSLKTLALLTAWCCNIKTRLSVTQSPLLNYTSRPGPYLSSMAEAQLTASAYRPCGAHGADSPSRDPNSGGLREKGELGEPRGEDGAFLLSWHTAAAYPEP